MIMWLRERNLLVDDIWQIPIDSVTSLDRREPMKKFVLVVTLGLAVLLCISMTISARENRFSFQTVIFPGDTFTQLLGINDLEMIAGYHGAAVNKGFVFTFPNNFTPENFPGSAQTQVIGINNQGHTDGFYIDTAGTTHGFLDVNGTFFTLDFPGATSTQAFGLNNEDDVVGAYIDAAGLTHGFIFDDGHFQSVDDPEGVGTTTINGINDRGEVVGFFVDAAGDTDGFVARFHREREREDD